MAAITLGGTPTTTNGNLPEVGSQLPDFDLTDKDMNSVNLNDFKGKKIVLNIFPSVDTGVCSKSVRDFNEQASAHPEVAVLCISRDLPFAQSRLCGNENLESVITLSDFKTGQFGRDYGVEIQSGAFAALNARAVVVADQQHKVRYTELVPEIGQAPNIEAALKALG